VRWQISPDEIQHGVRDDEFDSLSAFLRGRNAVLLDSDLAAIVAFQKKWNPGLPAPSSDEVIE